MQKKNLTARAAAAMTRPGDNMELGFSR